MTVTMLQTPELTATTSKGVTYPIRFRRVEKARTWGAHEVDGVVFSSFIEIEGQEYRCEFKTIRGSLVARLSRPDSKAVFGIDLCAAIRLDQDPAAALDAAREQAAKVARQEVARDLKALRGQTIHVSRTAGSFGWIYVVPFDLSGPTRTYLKECCESLRKGDAEWSAKQGDWVAEVSMDLLLQRRAEKEQTHATAEAKKAAAFQKARETNEPQLLGSYGDMEWNLPRHLQGDDEGDYCTVSIWAMPDGSVSESAAHSY
jgi:hypothetical protein